MIDNFSTLFGRHARHRRPWLISFSLDVARGPMTTKLPKLVWEIVEMEGILKAHIYEAIEDAATKFPRACVDHHQKQKGRTMNAKNPVLWISLFVMVLFAGLSVTRAQTGANADVVTAISNLENDAVKADLAGDAAFYQKVLAEDWTRGDSDGTWYTKAEVLKLMADTKNFKTNSEKLSELKVRVYGDTAVATYKDTYDILIKGEHRVHTIIATDTFVKMGGEWKQVASHGSEAK
jgi:Domain of unknown function (DUF4440)